MKINTPVNTRFIKIFTITGLLIIKVYQEVVYADKCGMILVYGDIL